MSRKRPPSPPHSPPPKRYLNAALAAELKSLRISSPTCTLPTRRTAFGSAQSPFLSQTEQAQTPPAFTASEVFFGDEFAQTLQTAPDVPVVTSPEPEPQHMAVEVGDLTTVYQSPKDDLLIEECNSDEAPTENRVMVYRPPVKLIAESLAKLNARLPDGRFILRNPTTDEWILTEVQHGNLKRKLAVVPWTGDTKRQLLDRATAPAKVIPMPWHEVPETNLVIDDAEQIMEIDDLDDD